MTTITLKKGKFIISFDDVRQVVTIEGVSYSYHEFKRVDIVAYRDALLRCGWKRIRRANGNGDKK